MNEKIKNYLGISIIIFILIFTYVAVSYVSTYSKSIESLGFRNFSVSAESKIIAIPDIAQFTFDVITEGGKDIAKLQKENTEKTNKIIEFIKSKGIDKKDIKTQSYNLNPKYQYSNCPVFLGDDRPETCSPPEIVGYAISQVVSVKIRNFEKIGDILGGVVENGANSVSELSFTIDDPAAVQNQAREEAIKKAKEKAAFIARTGGFKIGRLLSINEGEYYPSPFYAKDEFRGGEEAVMSLPSPIIEPGAQEISVTITLRYEIK